MPRKIVQHPQLGTLELCPNARARSFTFRPTAEGMRVTTPLLFTLKDLNACVDRILPRLLTLRERNAQKVQQQFIGPDFSIEREFFQMHLAEADVRRVAARFFKGALTISYPQGTSFDDATLQQWFVTVVEESLRRQAKIVLPDRLHQLAQQCGFTHGEVKIKKSHGRWGSCNGRKNINLSLYLLLLPTHLIDYVILHELCHTIEMNHSPRFWAKLDEVTGGCALQLRAEMKNYDTTIFTR